MTAQLTKSQDRFCSRSWATIDLLRVPHIHASVPGKQSQVIHERCTKHFYGLSSHTRLFPVAFESGEGCVLTDADGNRFLEFSSGICVATLGHGHPKVAQAISRQTRQLSNCHDFSTRVKAELVETLARLLPSELNCFQFYDSGATAIEAALRLMRAVTGRAGLLSCQDDYHGRTFLTSSLSGTEQESFPAEVATHLLPRPNVYRPCWMTDEGQIDTNAYLEHYATYLDQRPAKSIAGIVLEPIQGWAGTIIPPDDFFPKLRQFCDERDLILMADEVLTGWGRTG
ncbi:MAG: aminotransferase class III-fold pyridoxal phosphate-dependent enzyme, partial [Lacipirellulaceae bacterium]